jgi:hypothetical protein
MCYKTTIEHVFATVSIFRQTMYLTNRMAEQQLQGDRAMWSVKLTSELGKNESIATSPTVLYY